MGEVSAQFGPEAFCSEFRAELLTDEGLAEGEALCLYLSPDGEVLFLDLSAKFFLYSQYDKIFGPALTLT